MDLEDALSKFHITKKISYYKTNLKQQGLIFYLSYLLPEKGKKYLF